MYNNNYIERLNEDISFLKGFRAWIEKEEPEYSEKGRKALEERLIELKRELRKEYRRQKDDFAEKRVYWSEDGTSTKTFFYEYFDSEAEAEAWADEEYRMGQIYADYSPTGRWFVSDIRVAHVEGNRWLCMVEERIDV